MNLFWGSLILQEQIGYSMQLVMLANLISVYTFNLNWRKGINFYASAILRYIHLYLEKQYLLKSENQGNQEKYLEEGNLEGME